MEETTEPKHREALKKQKEWESEKPGSKVFIFRLTEEHGEEDVSISYEFMSDNTGEDFTHFCKQMTFLYGRLAGLD